MARPTAEALPQGDPSSLSVFYDTAAYQGGEVLPGAAEVPVSGLMIQSPAEAAAMPQPTRDRVAERFARWTAENADASQVLTTSSRPENTPGANVVGRTVLASRNGSAEGADHRIDWPAMPPRQERIDSRQPQLPNRTPEHHNDKELGRQRIVATGELVRNEGEPTIGLDVAAIKRADQYRRMSDDEIIGKDEDRILVNTKRGVFAVCDGAGGEDGLPNGPAIAAQKGAATFNAILSRFSHYGSDQEAYQVVGDAFKIASKNIVDAKGTISTAAFVQATYIDGTPVLLTGAAGDSRIFLDPKPGAQDLGSMQVLKQKLYMAETLDNEVAADEYRERLEKDGSLPYEWTRDSFGEPLDSWIGLQAKERSLPPRIGILPLKPGRTRFAITSDGVTGDSVRQLIEPQVFKTAMEAKNPMDAADMLMEASKKYDDKSIIVVDVYVSDTGEVSFAPADEAQAEPHNAPSAADKLLSLLRDDEEYAPVEITGDQVDGSVPDAALLHERSTAPPVVTSEETPAPVVEPGVPIAEAESANTESSPAVDSLNLTYNEWKDKLPSMDDDGEPMNYKKWLNKMPLERKLFLERHNLLSVTPEETPAPVVEPGVPAPADTGDRRAADPDDWSSDYLPSNLTGDTSGSSADGAGSSSMIDDWDAVGIPDWVDSSPAGTTHAPDTGDSRDGGTTSGDTAPAPVLTPDMAPPAAGLSFEQRRRKHRLQGVGLVAAAIATPFAVLGGTQGQGHDKAAAPHTAPAKPGDTKLGAGMAGTNAGNNGEQTTSGVQHDGAIDYRVVERNGKIISVETNLENRGLNGHGTPWAAATEALRLSGIERPTVPQIDALKDATLKAEGLSEAQARQLPDNYSISYDIVNGKPVPRR